MMKDVFMGDICEQSVTGYGALTLLAPVSTNWENNSCFQQSHIYTQHEYLIDSFNYIERSSYNKHL